MPFTVSPLIPVLALLLAVAFTTQVQAATPEPPPPVPANTRLVENLPYVPDGHERQVLDLYIPTGPAVKSPIPVVLYIHGGGLKGGSKDWARKEAVNNLVPAGMAVAAINYRLIKHAPFPAQMEDSKAALRWLRDHGAEYGLAVEKIGVWGYSAGAMLAALLATTDNDDAFEPAGGGSYPCAAALIWAGRADLTHLGPMTEKERKTVAGYYGLAPEQLESSIETLKSGSAVTYLNAGDAPLMLVHGDKDPYANISQTEIWKAAGEKAGVPVQIDIMPGVGHDIPADYDYAKVIAFFRQHAE